MKIFLVIAKEDINILVNISLQLSLLSSRDKNSIKFPDQWTQGMLQTFWLTATEPGNCNRYIGLVGIQNLTISCYAAVDLRTAQADQIAMKKKEAKKCLREEELGDVEDEDKPNPKHQKGNIPLMISRCIKIDPRE